MQRSNFQPCALGRRDYRGTRETFQPAPSGNISEQINALCTLAEEYRTVNADSALQLIEQAEQLATQTNSTSQLIHIYKVRSDLACDHRVPTDAISHYHHALTRCKEQGDTAKTAILYNNLALVFSRSGEYPTALNYHLQSLPLKELRKNMLGILLRRPTSSALW